jgi:hypothetical protein
MAIMIDIRIQLCAKWAQLRKRDSMNKKYFLLLTAISALSLSARADIIPTLDSVTGSSPNFTWNYSANVTVDQTVKAGDFFTIYDFSSIAPTTTTQPTGWTFSTALLGPTASLTSPTDNPNLWNLTWTYNGSTPISGSAALGIFTAVTSTDQLKTGQFTAQATRSSGPEAGSSVSNIGNVTVPVPEPSALFPIMSLCAAVGVDRFFRRRKTA